VGIKKNQSRESGREQEKEPQGLQGLGDLRTEGVGSEIWGGVSGRKAAMNGEGKLADDTGRGKNITYLTAGRKMGEICKEHLPPEETLSKKKGEEWKEGSTSASG